jgi:GT2 family glycosyltransferase
MLIELGCFDETHFAYLEDVDIGYVARLRGYKNRFCPEAVVLHAGSAASGSRYNTFKTGLASRNSIYIIAKNMPLLQIVLNLPLLLIGFIIKYLFFCRKGMGFLYLRSLGQGLKLSFSKAARARKVRFKWKYLGYYLRVQLELYLNIFRGIM